MNPRPAPWPSVEEATKSLDAAREAERQAQAELDQRRREKELLLAEQVRRDSEISDLEGEAGKLVTARKRAALKAKGAPSKALVDLQARADYVGARIDELRSEGAATAADRTAAAGLEGAAISKLRAAHVAALESLRILNEATVREAWSTFTNVMLTGAVEHRVLSREIEAVTGEPERPRTGSFLCASPLGTGAQSVAWSAALHALTIEAVKRLTGAPSRREKLLADLEALKAERGAA